MDIKILQTTKEFIDIISKVLNTAIDEELHIEQMAKEWKEKNDEICH